MQNVIPGTLPAPSPFGSATPRRDSLRSAPSPASVNNVIPIFPETPDYGSHAYDAFLAEMEPRLAYEMEVIPSTSRSKSSTTWIMLMRKKNWIT
jgi:hypothetical protein